MNTKFYACLASLFIVLSAVISLNFMSSAASAAGGRDCDANAIINCGALTAGELQQKYAANSTGDLPAVFDHYGISSAMVAGTSKMGTVGKDGNVIVDGKVVATGAQSVGRQDISGSTPVTIGDKTYFQRPTSVSFRSDTIPAIIYFDANGQYLAAVITSCANPVKANPVPVPPAPTPEKPLSEPPVAGCTSLKAKRIERDRYSFEATASADKGATISAYVFQVRKDSATGTLVETSTITSAAKSATSNVTTLEPGTYSVQVTVKTSVGDKSGVNCLITFTVEKPVEKVAEKPAPCVVPGKEHLPKDSPDCVEVKAAVPIIPSTGPAEMIGGGVAFSSLTAAGYYWRASRLNLISKLMQK